MNPSARFLVLLVLYVAIGNTILFVPLVGTKMVLPWTRLTTRASAAAASAVGVPSEAEDTVVRSGPSRLGIMGGCDGMHALIVVLSAILAFPTSWGRRLIGVVFGTIAIMGLNLVRIVNLIVIARYYPEWLKLFHVGIWETLIMAMAMGLFLAWWRFVATRGSSAAVRPA